MNRREWLANGKTVALGDEQIWYRVDGDHSGGDRPTLLLVHGFPTSSHDYAPMIARLAPRFRCVTFDLLGFGASTKPMIDYTYRLQHDALAKVAAAAGVKRAVLVVHDYAVTLGQDFLAGTPRAPFDLAGVIFLNGGIDPAQHRARPLQKLLANRVGAAIFGRFMTRDRALRALREVLVRQDALADDDVWAAITDHDGLRVMPRLLHYIAERRARRDALRAALATETTPIAFAWGTGDPVSGAHVLDAIRPIVGGAPILALSGVGHYPQCEAPAEIAAFIDRVAAGWLSAHKR